MKKLLLGLILVTLGLAGVAYWTTSAYPTNGDNPFTTAKVVYGSMSEVVEGTGIVQPLEVVIVSSALSGQVVYINADFNDKVTEGQTILKLDDRDALLKQKRAQAAVDLARADVDRARLEVDRVRYMRDAAWDRFHRLDQLDPSVPPKKELEESRLQWRAAGVGVQAAEATVGMAELKVREAAEVLALADLGVRMTEIKVPVVRHTAPHLGSVAEESTEPTGKRQYVVLDRKVNLNQMISPQTPTHLFVLVADLARVQVHMQVPEGDIAKIRKGQKARVATSGSSENLDGTVADVRLVPTPMPQLGAVFYTVVVDVTNRSDASGAWRLRPGMTTSVKIIHRTHDRVWQVPTEAIDLALDEPYKTEDAMNKIKGWSGRKDIDPDQWKPVWVLRDGKPWPIYARVRDAAGLIGMSEDGKYQGVLEWEAQLEPSPDPAMEHSLPQVIIQARPATPKGLLDLIKIKQ